MSEGLVDLLLPAARRLGIPPTALHATALRFAPDGAFAAVIPAAGIDGEAGAIGWAGLVAAIRAREGRGAAAIACAPADDAWAGLMQRRPTADRAAGYSDDDVLISIGPAQRPGTGLRGERGDEGSDDEGSDTPSSGPDLYVPDLSALVRALTMPQPRPPPLPTPRPPPPPPPPPLSTPEQHRTEYEAGGRTDTSEHIGEKRIE